ncbi:MAG: hypothetical protein QME51_09455 [Planctomycetota bacterium]|nr:hypothetical protein [Planctomycetota bacterium]
MNNAGYNIFGLPLRPLSGHLVSAGLPAAGRDWLTTEIPNSPSAIPQVRCPPNWVKLPLSRIIHKLR